MTAVGLGASVGFGAMVGMGAAVGFGTAVGEAIGAGVGTGTPDEISRTNPRAKNKKTNPNRQAARTPATIPTSVLNA